MKMKNQRELHTRRKINKKTFKNIYENPYTHVSISKYKEKLILFNDTLLEETIFKNKHMILEKKYYASGKLATEIPMKNGLING